MKKLQTHPLATTRLTTFREAPHHAGTRHLCRSESGLRVAVGFSVAAVALLIVGCGESADAIAIRQQIAERQLSSPQYVEPRQPVPVRKWSGKTNAMLAPQVHGLGRLSPSAAYAIDTGEGVILIDCGAEEQSTELRAGLIEVGLKMEDVKFVLLTHAHYDHVLGSNRVREVSGATVCAGTDDADVLRNADAFALFSLFPKTAFTGTPILVDRLLQDGDTIELGDTIISAIASPGHTPGSMCYLAERDGMRILFSGDVIASRRFGPATYPISISPRYRGDAESYLNTINKLLAMDVPDVLLAAHPRQQKYASPVSIDLQKWQELLQPAKQEARTVLQRHQQDGPDFLDGTPKQIEAGLFYLGEIDDVAVYGLIDVEQFIVINAPGGDRFLSLLQDRFNMLELEFREPDAVLLTTLQEKESSGLASLASTTPVMAPAGGQALFAGEHPRPVLDQTALEQLASMPIEVIAIGNPEPFALTYLFEIRNKRVLVTPAAPRNISLDWVTRKSGAAQSSPLQPQYDDLRELVQSTEIEREKYLAKLDAVADLQPDIWLPSLPLTGQNANLYDETWSRTLRANRQLAMDSTQN